MAKTNGTLALILRIVAILIPLLGIGAAVIAKFTMVDTEVTHTKHEIEGVKDGLKTYVWPQIEASKQHITRDELNQTYMDRRFDKLEKGLNDFSVEQRAVNKEILRKLE